MDNTSRFELVVNNQSYDTWKSASVTRSLDDASGSFRVIVVDPDRSLIKSYRPGVACRVELDGRTVVDGHLDGWNFDDKNGRTYEFIGRDRVGDLIDCAATIDGPYEFSNLTLDKIAKTILKPFKMPVYVSGDVGRAFSKLSIEPSETAFTFIERACRYRGLRPLSNGVGGLILAKPFSVRSRGQLILGHNIETRSANISHQDRHSIIVVKGQSSASAFSSAEDNAHAKGQARDNAISRYRPLVIVAEKDGYDLDMQERAEWEIRHRRYKGVSATYTVGSWYASQDEIWKLNTLVPVKDEDLIINRDMLIKNITFSRHETEGTKTEISIAPPEAYDLPAIRQSNEDDDVWGGGL